MGSTSTYRVRITGDIRRRLTALQQQDPRRCRRLALLMLTLEKDPEPDGSRELTLPGHPSPAPRVWEYAEFWMAYEVDHENKLVDIGLVEIRRDGRRPGP